VLSGSGTFPGEPIPKRGWRSAPYQWVAYRDQRGCRNSTRKFGDWVSMRRGRGHWTCSRRYHLLWWMTLISPCYLYTFTWRKVKSLAPCRPGCHGIPQRDTSGI